LTSKRSNQGCGPSPGEIYFNDQRILVKAGSWPCHFNYTADGKVCSLKNVDATGTDALQGLDSGEISHDRPMRGQEILISRFSGQGTFDSGELTLDRAEIRRAGSPPSSGY
jgi:hypothetical protein